MADGVRYVQLACATRAAPQAVNRALGYDEQAEVFVDKYNLGFDHVRLAFGPTRRWLTSCRPSRHGEPDRDPVVAADPVPETGLPRMSESTIMPSILVVSLRRSQIR